MEKDESWTQRDEHISIAKLLMVMSNHFFKF